MNWAQKHLSFIIIGLISIFIIATFMIYGHVTDCLDYYSKPLSAMSSIAVIVSVVFVAFQVRMAARQLNAVSGQAKSASNELELLYQDYNRRKEHSEFETAYKLAGYYAKNIIPRLAYLNRFFDNINRKVAKDYYAKASQFRTFNQAEAERLFGKDIIIKFQHEFWNVNNMIISLDLFEFLSGSKLYAPSDNDLSTLFKIMESYRNKKTTTPNKDQKKHADFLNEKFFIVQKDITNIINDIEYFSMYFCAGLATPDAVYISLHQTYLEVIINAYLFICFKNTVPGHEYYAHTIQLYNTWTQKSSAADEKRREELERISKPAEPQKMHSA